MISYVNTVKHLRLDAANGAVDFIDDPYSSSPPDVGGSVYIYVNRVEALENVVVLARPMSDEVWMHPLVIDTLPLIENI